MSDSKKNLIALIKVLEPTDNIYKNILGYIDDLTKKDITKYEIPVHVKEELKKKYKRTIYPDFWGTLISSLFDEIEDIRSKNQKLIDKNKELEKEIDIRTEQYEESVLANSLKRLQSIGYKLEILVKEK